MTGIVLVAGVVAGVFVQGARSSGANKRLVVSVPPSYTQPLLFLGIALDTV